MFERLDRLPQDPILGLMAQFRADGDVRKVDLGVGVYRNERGETPMLDAVKRAEKHGVRRGDHQDLTWPRWATRPSMRRWNSWCSASRTRCLPPSASAPSRRLAGAAHCALGAELIRVGTPDAVVHVSSPTWANHMPLIGGSGLKLERYPYLRPGDRRRGLRRDAGGAREDSGARRRVAACLLPQPVRRGPERGRNGASSCLCSNAAGSCLILDMAYQGLGTVASRRTPLPSGYVAAELPEALVAVSCSKNFGLYRERVGALHVISEKPEAGDAVLSQLVRIAARSTRCRRITARRSCRDPERYDPACAVGRRSDRRCVNASLACASALVSELRNAPPQRDFSFIERQRGMFSFLGVDAAQVTALREQHHVYMTDDSRMNIAGLRKENIEYFAKAVAAVLGRVVPSARIRGQRQRVRRFHLFHHEVRVRLLHAAHRCDAFQKTAVGLHIPHTYLQQVVESAGHHVAVHDLIVRQHRRLEALERVGRGAIQLHFDVGEQTQSESSGAQVRDVAFDVPATSRDGERVRAWESPSGAPRARAVRRTLARPAEAGRAACGRCGPARGQPPVHRASRSCGHGVFAAGFHSRFSCNTRNNAEIILCQCRYYKRVSLPR